VSTTPKRIFLEFEGGPRAEATLLLDAAPKTAEAIWSALASLMAGLDFELWEVGIFYGKGGRIFGPLGWTPCTIWASITSGLEEFAAACQETRTIGLKKLTIGRIE